VVVPHFKNGSPDLLAAFIILKEKTAQTNFETARVLKRELAGYLPAYMLPRKILFLDKFPMTANGKVDRRKLAESLK